MSVDATLAAIDGALQDWGTSEDAMRWQPEHERVICDDGRPLMPVRQPPNFWAICPEPYVQINAYAESFQRAAVSFSVDVQPFIEGLKRACDAITRAFLTACPAAVEPFTRLAHSAHAIQYPRQHIRCSRCNPAGNPKPLAVSGTAYRRRQRNRRLRRR